MHPNPEQQQLDHWAEVFYTQYSLSIVESGGDARGLYQWKDLHELDRKAWRAAVAKISDIVFSETEAVSSRRLTTQDGSFRSVSFSVHDGEYELSPDILEAL